MHHNPGPNICMKNGEDEITARIMHRSSSLFLAAAIALNVVPTVLAAEPPAREAIEWCDIWISHANETNQPRVLLIGDSIVRDYYPEVEKLLAGKAFVARLATSRFVADPVLSEKSSWFSRARISMSSSSTTVCTAGNMLKRNIKRHSACMHRRPS